MKRLVTCLGLAGLLVCLAPIPMLAIDDGGGQLTLQPNRNTRVGYIVVEVLEITDRSPVPGVRVELLLGSRIVRTDATGRVRFTLRAGEYDLRVHDLTGPGPGIRIDELHATVVAGQTAVIQVLDCGACL